MVNLVHPTSLALACYESWMRFRAIGEAILGNQRSQRWLRRVAAAPKQVSFYHEPPTRSTSSKGTNAHPLNHEGPQRTGQFLEFLVFNSRFGDRSVRLAVHRQPSYRHCHYLGTSEPLYQVKLLSALRSGKCSASTSASEALFSSRKIQVILLLYIHSSPRSVKINENL